MNTRHHTYTTALLEVKRETYDDIRGRLEAAGYHQAIALDPTGKRSGSEALDMAGLAIVPPAEAKTRCEMIDVTPDENGFGVESQCSNDASFRIERAQLSICWPCLQGKFRDDVISEAEAKTLKVL